MATHARRFYGARLQSAREAGYAGFAPDACLINCYEPGSRLSLHQDKNERDFLHPIVSVSLGLPATFLFGGPKRTNPITKYALFHGDVVVWGGPSRLFYHASQRSKMANTRSSGNGGSISRSERHFDFRAKNGVYGTADIGDMYPKVTPSWSDAMSDKIHYTWGLSSLGEFMVAASGQGVVAFEFSDDRIGMIKALRERFPGATIEPDMAALSATAHKLQLLIDNPDQDADLAIDPRGSAYEKQVRRCCVQLSRARRPITVRSPRSSGRATRATLRKPSVPTP